MSKSTKKHAREEEKDTGPRFREAKVTILVSEQALENNNDDDDDDKNASINCKNFQPHYVRTFPLREVDVQKPTIPIAAALCLACRIIVEAPQRVDYYSGHGDEDHEAAHQVKKKKSGMEELLGKGGVSSDGKKKGKARGQTKKDKLLALRLGQSVAVYNQSVGWKTKDHTHVFADEFPSGSGVFDLQKRYILPPVLVYTISLTLLCTVVTQHTSWSVMLMEIICLSCLSRSVLATRIVPLCTRFKCSSH